MIRRSEEKQFHGVIHCGDISYANKFNGTKPDRAEQVDLGYKLKIKGHINPPMFDVIDDKHEGVINYYV